jgi:hypothetical protein
MPTTETLADRLARPPAGATGSLTSPSWSQRPRLAQEQDVGAAVSPNALVRGDLAVWGGHVAMMVGNGMMIEAGC